MTNGNNRGSSCYLNTTQEVQQSCDVYALGVRDTTQAYHPSAMRSISPAPLERGLPTARIIGHAWIEPCGI